METTARQDLEFASIRSRARRLRLPAPPKVEQMVELRRYNSFGLGMLFALLIDLIAVAAFACSPDPTMAFLLLLGPLPVILGVPELSVATVVLMAVACVTQRWRLAAGLVLFQLAAVALGFVWLGLLGGGILPMY